MNITSNWKPRYCLLVGLCCALSALAPPVKASLPGGWTVEFLLTWQHTSDISRAPPEPTQNYYAFGATIASPKRIFEIDLTHGRREICTARICWQPESGSEVGVRFYPGRLR